MKTFLISYSLLLLFLLILDAIWLSVMLPMVYMQHLSHLLSESINYFPAVIFYLVYAFGIYFFILKDAHKNFWSLKKVFLYGFLFGVACYSTYDLTNQATLKSWPYMITLFDITWGGLLTGFSSVFTALVLRKI